MTSKLPNTALKLLDISYNKLTDIQAVQYLLGLNTLRFQVNPMKIDDAIIHGLKSLRHLKEMIVETEKLQSNQL